MASILNNQQVNFHSYYLADPYINSWVSYSRETKITYNFYNHFHPYVGFLLETLSRESLEELLASETQEKREDFFDSIYDPNESELTVGVTYQPKENDVSEEGPYSIYNWELFFHVPFSVAVHLSKNQRFAEAQKWFHYIFDPTSNDQTQDPPMRFWKFKAFRQSSEVQLIDDILTSLSSEEDSELKDRVEASIAGWRENPFQPHAIARTRFVAYQFNVVMKYLDNLIAWGDSLFRQDTIETINEATQLYVLAANILGERPQEIPRRGTTKAQTFASLRTSLDAFGNALVDLEGQFPFNLNLPKTQKVDTDRTKTLFGVGQTLYFCIPENDTLLGYWDLVADRLFKIRNCMNIEGVVRQLPLFQPPIDPGMLVKAAAAGLDLSSVISGLNQPVSPIRFALLIQKALEVCNEVRSLGNNLLSALEKKDGESLALLRQQQEITMMELMSDVRLLQWKEAEANTDALLKSRESAYQRYKHYQRLLGKAEDNYSGQEAIELERIAFIEGETQEDREGNFDSLYGELVGKYASDMELEVDPLLELIDGSPLLLNKNENADLNIHMPNANSLHNQAFGYQTMAPILGAIPQFPINLHYWGIGTTIEFGGEQLKQGAEFGAKLANNVASNEIHKGTSASKSAGFQRRAQDWTLQSNLAAKELAQIGQQIVASLIREQAAKHEYENQQQQLEHSKEVDEFLKDKFTNEQLYTWMSSELSGLYYEFYKFAFDTAKQAEATMKYELMRPEVDEQTFIQFNYWDSGRKGLLSGESLCLDIKRMEMAYHEYNKREFELTKHISLRQLNPIALLELKTTGSCTLDIPEWVFDLDCPGHYMRRIKSVAVSIPAVAGPYTSINCTLSLQSSSVRKSALLKDDEYVRQEDDDRFVDYVGTIQSIVTSNAQNDSGLFEVNFRDERFLPFENAGVISTWNLGLPSDLRQFNYDTISDIILHVRYTARQGGTLLGDAATTYIKDELLPIANEVGLTRLWSLKHDFPNEWHRFEQEGGNFQVEVQKVQFPYLSQAFDVETQAIQILKSDGESLEYLQNTSVVAPADTQNDFDDPLNTDGAAMVELDLGSIEADVQYFIAISYALVES